MSISEPDVQERWLQALNTATISRFSAHDGESKETLTRQELKITPQDGPLAQITSEILLDESFDIIKLAWAFVLRCYIGSNQVTFVAQVSKNASCGLDVVESDFDQATRWQDVTSNTLCSLQYDELNESTRDELLRTVVKTCSTTVIVRSSDAVETDLSKHELSLIVATTRDGAELSFGYRSPITPDLVESIATTFTLVTKSIGSGLDTAIRSHSLLDELQHAKLSCWHAPLPLSSTVLVHDVISAQARRFPDHEAICSRHESITFRQLDRYATALAGHLQEMGVGAGIFVPFCFEKCAWTIVAMLAILKTGAAMVSVDPAYPAQRLEDILTRTAAKVVLTSKRCQAIFQGMETVVVNRQALEAMPLNKLTAKCDSRSPAYVHFTSGSTGKPKGVVILHESFTMSILGFLEKLKIDSTTRMLQFTSYTFDPSLMEIFSPLCAGACVCVPLPEQRTNDIVEAIIDLRANSAFLTPTFLKMVTPALLPKMKTLAIGGEALNKQCIEDWADNTYAVNGYGPTECTIMCTSNHITSTDVHPMNIGRAANCVTWIVDKDDASILMPLGAIGELLIQGPIVFDGYLGDAHLTSDAIIQEPPWLLPGTPETMRRAYKTGDLVRYDAEGNLIYIGRKDHQVKVRGQRVELGEIEQNILTCPAAKHVAVLLPKSGPYKGRLVALLADEVHASAEQPELKSSSPDPAIQDHVTQRLASYMIPSVWLNVTTLPINLAGKIARPILQRWLENISDEEYRRMIRRDTVDESMLSTRELAVRQAWATVLGLDAQDISKDTSFLALGGDSIMAMQVASACRAQQVRVKVTDVLLSKDFVDLASRHSEETKVLVAEPEGNPFDLSPVQRVHMNLSPGLENCSGQKFSLKLNRPVNTSKIDQGLQHIVEKHSMFRARFFQQNSEWQQVISASIESSYRLEEMTVDQRTFDDPASDFDIRNGPLLIAQVSRSDDTVAYIDLFCHHLVIDLVSWRIMLNDLENFLQDKLTTSTAVSFQTLQANRSEADSNVSTDQITANLDYWGLKHEENICGETESLQFSLNQAQSAEIISGCHSALNTEPVDVLLASVAHSFVQTFHDRQCPALFNESHGRDLWHADVDTSETVGWFTSVYPVQADLDHNTELIDLIRLIKDQRYFSTKRGAANGFSNFGQDSQCEVLFNYMGAFKQLQQADSLWTMQPGSGMDFGGKQLRRFAVFELSVSLESDCAVFTLVFNRRMKKIAKIHDWMDRWQHSVDEVVQALKDHPRQLTRSDYPSAKLSYDDLACIEKVTEARQIEALCPASPIQKAMLNSQKQSSAFYHNENFVKLKDLDNSVDVEKLSRAWETVVQRHAALRTVFVETSNGWTQIILRQCKPEIVLTDVRPVKQDHKLQQPQHRLTIWQDGTDVVLYFELSHTISDQQTAILAQRDLALAYQGQMSDKASGFHDIISHLDMRSDVAGAAYWAKHMESIEPCMLPTTTRCHPGELQAVTSTLGLTSIKKKAQDFSVTVSTLVRLAWSVVLSNRLQQQNVSYGFVLSARNLPVDSDEIAGPFLSILPAQQSMNGSVQTALQGIQSEFANVMMHQHAVPAGSSKLFNTLINCRKSAERVPLTINRLQLEHILEVDPFDYAVVLELDEMVSGMHAKLSYWSNTIAAEDAAMLLDEFQHALALISDSPADSDLASMK